MFIEEGDFNDIEPSNAVSDTEDAIDNLTDNIIITVWIYNLYPLSDIVDVLDHFGSNGHDVVVCGCTNYTQNLRLVEALDDMDSQNDGEGLGYLQTTYGEALLDEDLVPFGGDAGWNGEDADNPDA